MLKRFESYNVDYIPSLLGISSANRKRLYSPFLFFLRVRLDMCFKFLLDKTRHKDTNR
jgi:hypothetical protein